MRSAMDLRTSFFLMLLLAYYACSESSNDENYQVSEEPAASKDLIEKEYISKYTLHTKATFWLDALLVCGAKGATLAVPRSREDATALGRLLTSASAIITGAEMRDAVHVGLTDSEVEGDWWTVGGSSLAATGYNNWLGGRQEQNASADCAAILADGHYIQVSCDAVLAFACEPLPTPAERSDGYVDIADIGSYKLHTEPLTWGEAGRRCAEEGATLAVPKSPRMAGVLAGAFVVAAVDEKIKEEGIFVGINDLASEGVWRTVLDEQLETTGYATWAPDKPSGGRDNNCGALLADGRYADYPCTKPMAFCCELGGPGRKDEEPFATLGRYSLFAKELPWLSAEIHCLRRNATLAAPRNQEEFNILQTLAGQLTNQNYELHLGAFFDTHSNSLRNGNGERIFESNQPYFTSDKCIAYASMYNYMHTNNCNEQHRYICESYSKT